MNKIMRLYTVYDVVAGEMGPPNLAVNDGVAARMYRGEMDKLPPYLKRDYKLLYLGDIDMVTGVIRSKSAEEIQERGLDEVDTGVNNE